MTSYGTKMIDRRNVAEDTLAFYFTKPHGFEFKPGQFVEVKLKGRNAEERSRTFSIASAPGEKELMIATRIHDTDFKRALKTVPLGTEIEIEGPFGSLTPVPSRLQPLTFLAGGIGVTPFRSILVQATKDGSSCDLCLFYSNRRPEDAAFIEEFQRLEKENSHFKLIATMTKVERSRREWQGEKGHIDSDMLKPGMGDLDAPLYYVAGSSAMVQALQQMLHGAGVSKEKVRAEEFTGY